MMKNIKISKSGKKNISLLLFLGLVGILLLSLSKCAADDTKTSKEGELENLDPAKYALEVEERVEQLCNKIDGVSSTHAVVTLAGGYRAIYATDSQFGSSNSKNQTVIVGSGSNEKALLIGYKNPEIAGIGIVCSGGADARVRAEIIAVVSSAFGVGANKIFVTGG